MTIQYEPAGRVARNFGATAARVGREGGAVVALRYGTPVVVVARPQDLREELLREVDLARRERSGRPLGTRKPPTAELDQGGGSGRRTGVRRTEGRTRDALSGASEGGRP